MKTNAPLWLSNIVRIVAWAFLGLMLFPLFRPDANAGPLAATTQKSAIAQYNNGMPEGNPQSTTTNPATDTPTVTLTPTFTPTNTPTSTPTNTPTSTPTNTPTPTPTNTPTSTPTSTNTPTSTPTVTATPTNMASPIIKEIVPDQGTNDVPNEITVRGKHFAHGAVVALGTSPPMTLANTVRLDSERLRVTIPPGLSAGTYDLHVVNPNSATSNAVPYTVVEPLGVDDLYSTAYELYTDPVTIHEGDAVDLFLIIHRRGGKETLANVVVRFYDGNPEHDGALIGEGQVFLLEPDGNQITLPVSWNTTGTRGWHVLYAVIDPENEVDETNEGNNVVRREIKIHEPPADNSPPIVTAFQINDGADVTHSPEVGLDVSAQDDAGGSGMDATFFVELMFNQAVGQWVPVQGSGWLPYSAHYAWSLIDSAGMHYMQAWAADKAGNISLFPALAHINYIPEADHVEANQARVYRQYVEAGQRLTVVLTPVSGDPDLYVWPPVEDAAPWVSDDYGTAEDSVSFVAETTGTYQIEVYGYTAAEYTISIEVTNAAGLQSEGMSESATVTHLNTSKTSPSQPVTAVGDEPAGQMAVPPAEMCHDIDGDEWVDVNDIAQVAAVWMQDAGAPYDVDQNGLVTVLDIMRVASQWGKGCICRDIDGDDVVTGGDLSRIAGQWRQDAGPLYDLDLSGLVTILDVMELNKSWGQVCQ